MEITIRVDIYRSQKRFMDPHYFGAHLTTRRKEIQMASFLKLQYLCQDPVRGASSHRLQVQSAGRGPSQDRFGRAPRPVQKIKTRLLVLYFHEFLVSLNKFGVFVLFVFGGKPNGNQTTE
jgi:hypothetical protein